MQVSRKFKSLLFIFENEIFLKLTVLKYCKRATYQISKRSKSQKCMAKSHIWLADHGPVRPLLVACPIKVEIIKANIYKHLINCLLFYNEFNLHQSKTLVIYAGFFGWGGPQNVWGVRFFKGGTKFYYWAKP